MKHFYNTTKESGQRLLDFEHKARTQEERIYAHLKARPFHWFTSYALCDVLFEGKVPVTSVRRALTNLHQAGKILRSHTADTMGEYGHNVYRYCCALTDQK